MSDATPLLRVDGLRKWFPVRSGVLGSTRGHVQAVDGISFQVAKGATLGICAWQAGQRKGPDHDAAK